MPIISPYGGRAPRLHASVFVAENAVVVGDVEIGEGSSIWFGTVVRGDVNHVRIGARTNLQDLTVVHVTSGTHPTVIGDDVTVGHRAVLHGCTIRDRCLVGIGAIVMDGAVVGPDAMVGAGALVAARHGRPARHPRAGIAREAAARAHAGGAGLPPDVGGAVCRVRRALPRRGGRGMTAFEALKRADLFGDFTETGLRIFASIAVEKSIPAGTPLFVENMVGESLFIVKSGTVRLTQRTPEGETRASGRGRRRAPRARWRSWAGASGSCPRSPRPPARSWRSPSATSSGSSRRSRRPA